MNPINYSLQNFQLILDLLLFGASGFLFFLIFILVRRLCDIRQELEELTNGMAELAGELEAAKTQGQLPKAEKKASLSEGLIPVVRKPQSLLAKTELLVRAVPVPKVVQKHYIAKGGENIGEIDMLTIKRMVQSGQLSLRDYFFENNSQKWSTIDCLPGLS